MRKHSLTRLIGMGVLIPLSLMGCGKQPGRLYAQFKKYNIVLISIDTLRADHLGCYGYWKKTPYIDSIATKGFVFETMFTTSSTTFPAHVSLLTSLHPRDCRNGYHLRNSVTTLAETLRENGYMCLAVVSGLPLDARFHLDQGFDYYDSDFSNCTGSIHLRDNKWFAHNYQVFDCSASEVTQKVITAVRGKISKPYFLWVHYYDPHFPYNPPPRYYHSDKVTRRSFPFYHTPTPSDLESLNELYDGEIQFVDDQLKKLIDSLKQQGMYDNTVVIIVSDHGENLYEHDNYLDHSQVVYDTVMWIPCILFLPGVQGKRMREIVSIIDVMPTVLDLVGIRYEGLEGCSMIEMMEKQKSVSVRSYVTCETNDFGVREEDQTVAVRTKTAKYINNNWKRKKDFFYDLRVDPQEIQPMENIPGVDEKTLKAIYQEWRSHYKTGHLASRFELDRETKEVLKSLGYVQ